MYRSFPRAWYQILRYRQAQRDHRRERLPTRPLAEGGQIKRPGYTGVAPTAPESDQLMSGVISGILRCPGECAAISGRNQLGALVIAGPAIENTPLFCALSSAEFRFTFQVPDRKSVV